MTGGDVSTLLGELDCVRCAAPSAMRGGGLVVVRFVVLISFRVGATMLCALLSWAVAVGVRPHTGRFGLGGDELSGPNVVTACPVGLCYGSYGSRCFCIVAVRDSCMQ